MPPARGGRLQPRPPCKGATGCGRARPPAARSHGQPPEGGRLQRGAHSHAIGAAANGLQTAPIGATPVEVPAAGVAAPW
ncbi:hypothetical protein BHE74_00036872 [Ensete ventricosum]|nr:hypothetical protein GW17_00035748 [Ensete ventricosum]RWW56411.1 hypothetical protein BHE74_00036872 [Ensete ventricosum]